MKLLQELVPGCNKVSRCRFLNRSVSYCHFNNGSSQWWLVFGLLDEKIKILALILIMLFVIHCFLYPLIKTGYVFVTFLTIKSWCLFYQEKCPLCPPVLVLKCPSLNAVFFSLYIDISNIYFFFPLVISLMDFFLLFLTVLRVGFLPVFLYVCERRVFLPFYLKEPVYP